LVGRNIISMHAPEEGIHLIYQAAVKNFTQ
jgi:hypothetical protein